MRIAILSVGSRGDFEPYLALGLGLRDAGHDVLLATHSTFESATRAAGLNYAPIKGDPHRGVAQALETAGADRDVRKFAALRGMGRNSNVRMVRAMHDGLIACRDADLVIASPFGAGLGFHLAERLHVPLIRAFYAPLTPTREFPAISLTAMNDDHGLVNLWTYSLGRQLIWLMTRRSMNRARQEVLGLPPLSLKDPFGAMDRQRWLLLYGFSELVVPRPADWGDWVQITGHWFPRDPVDWSPPADLLSFLAGGPPPIYIGFGSMARRDLRKITDQFVNAALDSGHRVIVSAGWGEPGVGNSSADVYEVGDIPHSWLFPRMAAVIHHGGAGTTSQGLRAGVPTLIVPFIADQFYWGKRVQELGVGSPPVRPSEVQRVDLRPLIKELVESPSMRQRAEELGRQIRSEDGVGRAVQLIEEYAELQGVNH